MVEEYLPSKLNTIEKNLGVTLCLWILLLGFSFSSAQARLLVCVPGSTNTQQIQNGFDTLLGPEKAMAFGRIKDLEAMLSSMPDAMIIAPAAFLDYLPGYKVSLVGKVKNEVGEKYLIIATSKSVTLKNVAEKKIGIVDFLGRERLSHFIQTQFGIEPKILKRVNKKEDLLTMLGMEVVDAIIVSTSDYQEILSNTKLTLNEVAASEKNIGFSVFASKQGKEDVAIKKALLKQPLSLSKAESIDKWEVLQ